ncbi:MAG: PcfK-like family protein [Alloprevotella sp.]|nr:PcfK-like family protein [Alloprevotella sp.]
MKGTEQFTRAIAEYLNQRAMSDPLFAPNLAKPHKNIEDCVCYILNQVKASGCCGFEDDEIYSMAVHYYDEDELEVGSPVSCNVVVNHTVVLTEEEKAEAHKQAIQQYQAEELRKLQEPKRVKVKASTNNEQTPQPSLFDTL